MKVAIVHDYLSEYGGAEKVVNAIYEIYPNADIYSATLNRSELNKANAFKGAKIYAPKISGVLSPIKKFFVFSYPIYFENLNLKKYDLVIISTAHFAKGVYASPNALSVCYIHTPPRFLWGLKTESSIRDNPILKYPLKLADNYLRMWDYAAAQRPDYLITNSKNVKQRIKKFYKRKAKVIYPFYDFNLTAKQISKIKPKKGEYFFTISRFGKYKNLDLIAKVFNEQKQVIYIAGSGSKNSELKKYEGKYVKLLGFISEKQKVAFYKGCKAFVLATKDEDFGITPLEAMSFGKPVIALNSGGFKETVNSSVGVLFNKATKTSLKTALVKFNNKKFSSEKIKKHAKNFSKQNFKKEFKHFINTKLKELQK